VSRFAGRVVFITGASSGIGAALARAFVREDAAVALTARRLPRLHELAGELNRHGRAVAIECDVTRDGDLEHAVAIARERLGPIAIAVANAGFGVMGRIDRLALDDYRRQFETNVFGVLRTIHATLPDLERTRGALVLVGSVSGHVGVPGTSPYAMSKFAIRGLAQSLRHELGPRGVSVVLVSPGYVVSEIYQVDNRGIRHPEARDPIPAWLRMDVDRAARQVVDAVARGRAERVITAHGKVIVFAQRHVPWLVSAIVRRFGVKSRPEARSARA
jgi:NAD(P)-dependent dehydrogenase (short-subunit alcohol dehydrogenase family)